MGGSFSGESIFHKIAKKEDDYTQLLCNFMQRSEEFRSAVLSLLFDEESLASKISREQIVTQVVIPEVGRPDILIESPDISATVEVKLSYHRRCEESQIPSLGDMRGYCGFLDRASANARKRLVFLVPGGWKHLQATKERLDEFGRSNPGIETKIVCWEKVFALSKRFGGDPLLAEFWKLLERDFGSVQFTEDEIQIMFSAGLPIEAINKAAWMVDQIAKKCSGDFIFDGPEHEKSGEQYGLEFYRKTGKGRGDSFLFWFGIWSPFWEKHGKPLCF